MDEKPRLAINSIALFFRMLLRLAIALYTTRIIIENLGTENYGIYILVSGFTIMFSFVNSSLSTAASRFLSYAIGHSDNLKKIEYIFRVVFTIQISIAVVVIIIGGIIGYAFIVYYIKIPKSMIFAAIVLFYCTLFNLALQIMQVPYNATIIAYEKMSAYAYLEIINSVLLLLIAFTLKCQWENPLIVYGVLLLCLSIIMFVSYIIYCRRFKVCSMSLLFDWRNAKSMLTFSCADLFSNGALAVQSQSQNIIFNQFYTLSANAAIGIASQFYGAMLMFSSSITTAVRPRIIKYYAASDVAKSLNIVIVSSSILSFALITISVPIILKREYILNMWLGNYPMDASIFVAIILLMNATFGYKGILVILIHATGEISRFSIINGLIYLAAIFLQYILAKLEFSYAINYGVIILLAMMNVFLNIIFIGRLLNVSIRKLIVENALPPIIAVVLSLVLSAYIEKFFSNSIMGTICFMAVSSMMSLFICWRIVLNRSIRKEVYKVIKRGLHIK